MQKLQYLQGYPENLTAQVTSLIETKKLPTLLLGKYPAPHEIRTDKALYEYVLAIKNSSMQQSQPLSKVLYDSKIKMHNQALGVHKIISRVQGGKLKAKNEIRIASTFRNAPEPLLRMIVVHELAHLKEKSHDKAFYKLCKHLEPQYHQLELDMRLYLTQLDLFGPLYVPQ
ncbi:YgjP-like metallopeptidase domain-containing protein [Desulforhopalus sp. IMCC35007]|uniref:YgjP-like metallopeptidase domain-containing protein n=1 Tax=Desulforhopalus sp. IMCC35007 TaxID=2569543 RepID=UPI0010AE30A0|nr:YgjP-like metallopeptidase domain-containing protein [Desulforhopalus sp. IMCC35007]TKB06685.1 M48 family metallopeptidase [Desulforhopalus sp. IMCC35007]